MASRSKSCSTTPCASTCGLLLCALPLHPHHVPVQVSEGVVAAALTLTGCCGQAQLGPAARLHSRAPAAKQPREGSLASSNSGDRSHSGVCSLCGLPVSALVLRQPANSKCFAQTKPRHARKMHTTRRIRRRLCANTATCVTNNSHKRLISVQGPVLFQICASPRCWLCKS